jgi:hypothetical protein
MLYNKNNTFISEFQAAKENELRQKDYQSSNKFTCFQGTLVLKKILFGQT